MEILYCHEWLKGSQDYNSGLEYYLQFGENEVLKNLLKRGPTKFNFEKLRSEIQELAKSNPEIYLPGAQKRKINRADLPDFLKLDYDKLHSLIQTISHHHSRLDLIQNNTDRYNCAATILNATEERRRIFQRIDHFIQHGSDLVIKESSKILEVKVLSEDPEVRKLQLKNELILLRSQRTKLKNKPHRVADYNKAVSRIEEIERELKP
jgi:hypothetical protein